MAEPAASGNWDADALRTLEARLDQAAAAAERLLGEAALGAQDRDQRTPPGGWQRPHQDPRGGERFAGWLDPADGELLLALLAGLRDRIPVDLQQRLVAALRELVLALRALIDWCVQRAERRRGGTGAVPVQDIPIL